MPSLSLTLNVEPLAQTWNKFECFYFKVTAINVTQAYSKQSRSPRRRLRAGGQGRPEPVNGCLIFSILQHAGGCKKDEDISEGTIAKQGNEGQYN